jgi:hypothetical protein
MNSHMIVVVLLLNYSFLLHIVSLAQGWQTLPQKPSVPLSICFTCSLQWPPELSYWVAPVLSIWSRICFELSVLCMIICRATEGYAWVARTQTVVAASQWCYCIDHICSYWACSREGRQQSTRCQAQNSHRKLDSHLLLLYCVLVNLQSTISLQQGLWLLSSDP